ncbi:MAG: PPOX class F420-dependent oxidoreductase [Ilumatobacteraceae bacterium]|jgi:PPOX class probable F420-dependent enzyme|nr:PPOX class F420-dependent oxidoreductase [Ilumatobacteraceae bacterium]
MPADLDSAKYVSFVTYKKDGTPVATPVWIVPFDGGYAFTTEPDAYKVRRIRHDARATLTVCNMSGKISEGAITHIGSAVVLGDDDAKKVTKLIEKKYSIGTKLLGVMSLVKKLLGKGTTAGDGAIKVTLH